MSRVNVEIELPDTLATQAKKAGLLEPEALERMVREALLARRVDGLVEAREVLAANPLPPMTPEETGSYLRHHVTLAGRSDTLFSDDATALIHQTSRGYPRAVNNLALQALVAAFAADKNIVDESSARTAVTEVTTE